MVACDGQDHYGVFRNGSLDNTANWHQQQDDLERFFFITDISIISYTCNCSNRKKKSIANDGYALKYNEKMGTLLVNKHGNPHTDYVGHNFVDM